MHIDSQSFYDYTNYETNSVQGPIPVPMELEYVEKEYQAILNSSDSSATKIERYKALLERLDTLIANSPWMSGDEQVKCLDLRQKINLKKQWEEMLINLPPPPSSPGVLPKPKPFGMI